MNKLVLVLGLFLLAGCGDTKYIAKPELYTLTPYDYPKVDPVGQHQIQWIVVTKDNIDQIVKDIQTNNGSVVLFAVTPESYQNILLNEADLRRYIEAQGNIIVGMDHYYRQQPPPKTDTPVEEPKKKKFLGLF